MTCLFLPLHPGHPVQFHVVTPAKTFRKGIVLNLQLGYLKQQGKKST